MFVRSAKREKREQKKKFFTFSFMAIKINPQTKKQTTREKGNKQVRKSFFINWTINEHFCGCTNSKLIDRPGDLYEKWTFKLIKFATEDDFVEGYL